MNHADTAYINLCKLILNKGVKKSDRTKTNTLSLFGHEMKFDLSKDFPLITTKKVHFKSIVAELLWFLRGDTNIDFLKQHNVTIWNDFADANGNVGRMYGAQWRNYTHIDKVMIDGKPHYTEQNIDQIADLIDMIKTDPDSRRLLVNAWNVAEQPIDGLSPSENALLGFPALPPCHYSFQCYVENDKLSMIVNQRSVDVFLGLPFNIASYALLIHMLAQVTNLDVGELIWRGGDCHIYSNHVDQVKLQVARYDKGEVYSLPIVMIKPTIENIDDFVLSDFKLVGYQSGSSIKGDLAV